MTSLFANIPCVPLGVCRCFYGPFFGLIFIFFISQDDLNGQQLKPLARILEKDGSSVGSGGSLGRGLAVHSDINGDGYPDILVASYRPRKLHVYFSGRVF